MLVIGNTMKVQDLSLLTPEKKVELILLQAEENNLLKEENKKFKDNLQRLQNKNSKNSHKPVTKTNQRKPVAYAKNQVNLKEDNPATKAII